MQLVIWHRTAPGEWESPQGFKAYDVPEGWELIHETEDGQEISLHRNFKEIRIAAQKIMGFTIPENPLGQYGKRIREPIAYCVYHKYFLSHSDAKCHGCLKKMCKWMVRISSPHWDRRAEAKRNKKRRKSTNGTA